MGPMGPAARGFVVYQYPVLVALLLAAWLAALAVNAAPLAEAFERLTAPRIRRAVLAALAFGLLVRAVRPGPPHRLFYDEMEHLNMAQNLARAGAFGVSLAGGRPELNVVQIAHYWPAGYHVLLAAAFKLFGFGEGVAAYVSVAFAALSIAALSLAVLLAFEDGAAAAAAAWALALLPLHVRFSASADTTAASVFWLCASLAAVFWRLRRRDRASLALLAFTLAYAASLRGENLVLLPVCAGFLWKEQDRAAAKAAAVALACCALPIAALAAQRSADAARAFGAPLASLPGDLAFMLDFGSERPLLLALAALGLIRPEGRRAAALLAGWGLAFLAVYAAFFVGDFRLWDWPQASDRYALAAFYLPVLPLAALGLTLLPRRWAKAASAGFVLLCAPAWARLPDVGTDEPGRYGFLVEQREKLPRGLYVVSYSPATINVALGRPSVSPYFLLENPGALRDEELVLFQDFWWDLRGEASGLIEAQLRRGYDFSLLSRREHGGGSAWTFYRLTPKRDGA